MAYTRIDFSSGKKLREAFATKIPLQVYQPGPFGPNVPDGEAVIEGPHYPKPHKFYVRVTVKNNRIVEVHK